MSRRSTSLLPGGRDGTSQRGRELAELAPTSVTIDGRDHADLLAFVQALAGQLRFFSAEQVELRDAGSWTPFAQRDDITVADIVAYMHDPTRFEGERARWLGRPHFALLLSFLELLGHAREQLNGLTARHLDHYYRDILQMRPQPAAPDRASVVFRLAAGVTELRVPAGTALQAGRDSAGNPRIYRTERELIVSRARVDALRSVHAHRRITGIPDVRKDRGQSPDEAFDGALAIALGAPRPGDPVPPWNGRAIDRSFVLGLSAGLSFARERLFLDHHELRALMALVRRRADAGPEWAEINRLLGVRDPVDPRDFAANFTRVVGPLDFAADGLAQVNNIDDLYERRTIPEVREYIDLRLAALGHDNFTALMAIKQRIDAEWAEINRLLERLGARQRGLLAWELGAVAATDFADNLRRALGDAWPPPWPWGSSDIASYEATIRRLEAHLSMSAERLARLAELASAVETRSEGAWQELDALLADAHRERHHAARRAALAAVRGDHDDLPGFDALVRAALGNSQELLPWDLARTRLAPHLDPGQQALLDSFRGQLVDPAAARRFTWSDVERSLELAQRRITGSPEPVARKVVWRNLHVHDDPAADTLDPASPRWKTFGRPPIGASEAHPPAAAIGFALCSPSLALSQGQRTLTLTLGLRALDLPAFLRELGLLPELQSDTSLRAALGAALCVEVSGARGWVELPLASARLASGSPGDDYWTLLAEPRRHNEDRPGLRLQLVAGPELGPITPLPDSADPWPTLRVTLRQRWDAGAREWTTTLDPFAPLVLAAVHLRVEVDGLVDLRLQHEDRPLDPRRPLEPFGHRPAVGARMYLSHPELVGPRLDRLRLDITWMGLPGSLKANYRNYPGVTSAADFKARISLIDRGLGFTLADISLFREGPGPEARTAAAQTVELADIAGTIAAVSPGYHYTPRSDLPLTGDIRRADRYLQCELTPIDFGHSAYPVLAARKARELAIGLARGTVDPDAADGFALDPPYTPTIQRIVAAYQTSIELDPGADDQRVDRLLHVHPFGVSPIDPTSPHLLPRHDSAGELYIGLRDLIAPQRLALLWVVAEGTSAPDLDAVPVEWSVLDGDRWRSLAGNLRHDSTRGLLNSGIVELDLPAVAASTRLPAGRYWLRAAVASDAASVCDTVDIRAQAVTVCFDDRGNAPDHYAKPLPIRSIDRLLAPDPRIAAALQPYTSYGGTPAEADAHFYTRVSERLRHKHRALTPWDYERLVLQRFPAIYKASCLPAGPPGNVDIIVVPDIRQQLPSDAFAPRAPANLLADIQTYLAGIAPDAARVHVRNPHYVAVSVRLGVRFHAGQDLRHAQKRLSEDLSRFLSPWAYDEGAELTIGGKIYASSILDFVDRRDYVDYVAELRLARSDNGVDFTVLPPTDEDYHVAAERPDQVLVAAHEHHVDIISELDYQQTSFTGINYLKLELDFIIG
ncbi:baseplate J/gp47 family protein [Nannocystis sp.]|uniref:baseplate J/gp47 family protein n=1 Tax=Nannocystis sp. TaxID=1962667 RepID=UPI0025D565EA|nr:baseplate J/gp47 family protein [Nannocystis sp.]MBK7826422.1 baseplate J/gp47 family protein [Nannocystis sp.]